MTGDFGWDAIAYHMPFAARLVGICSADCFMMSDHLEQYFLAFPKSANFLQGVFWWTTGKPEAVSLVNLGGLILVVAYLRLVWSVPWALSTIALVAIPMVQIHATTGYIDLAVNSAATISALSVLRVLIVNERPSRSDFIWLIASVCFLGNSKLQMMPIAMIISIVFFATFLIRFPTIRKTILTVGSLTIVAVSWTGISNLLEYGNPVYPISLNILGIQFQGMRGVISKDSIPAYLADVPQPIRWLLSVLEFRAYDNRHTPWVFDQGNVGSDDYSFRMGGYFVAYVIIAITFITWKIATLPNYLRTKVTVFFAIMTVVVAAMPGSHELRYYMFWMMVLVSLFLALVWSSSLDQDSNDRASNPKLASFAIPAAMLASVICITGGQYLRSDRNSFDAEIRLSGIRENILSIPDKSFVCVRDPFRAFLYAKIFSPGMEYQTHQGESIRCQLTFQ